MGVEDRQLLLPFLEAFDPAIQAITLDLRERVWARYPDCNELIYDGPAALALGWSPTESGGDAFFSLAIYNNKGVLFGFLKGDVLSDPLHLLEGEGKHYRYIRVTDLDTFPEDHAFDLLEQSRDNALSALKKDPASRGGKTIVKSVSPKKRRPAKTS